MAADEGGKRQVKGNRKRVVNVRYGPRYLRIKRFLIFVGKVMKHTWTLILAIIGSAVLLIPAWVRPLLRKSWLPAFDQYTATLSPSVYWWLAMAVLLFGFLLACFFDWIISCNNSRSASSLMLSAIGSSSHLTVQARRQQLKLR